MKYCVLRSMDFFHEKHLCILKNAHNYFLHAGQV